MTDEKKTNSNEEKTKKMERADKNATYLIKILMFSIGKLKWECLKMRDVIKSQNVKLHCKKLTVRSSIWCWLIMRYINRKARNSSETELKCHF